jgi:hypothetical protein
MDVERIIGADELCSVVHHTVIFLHQWSKFIRNRKLTIYIVCQPVNRGTFA